MPTMSERSPQSADATPNWEEEIKDETPVPDEEKGEEEIAGGTDEGSPEHEEEPSEDDAAIEAEAADMGWQKDYTGDPAKYVDARTFVKRGREVLPILRARERESREKAERLEQEVAEIKEASKSYKAFIDKQAKDQNDFESAQLKARRLQALQEQDWDTVNEIDIEIGNRRAAPGPIAQPPREDPVVKELWESNVKTHPWLAEKQAQEDWGAEAVSLRLAGNRDTGKPFIERVNARMKRLYPDRFRGRASMVEGGGSPAGGVGNGASRTFEDLLPDYRNEFNKSARKLGLTKQEFVRECGPECFRR